ncbi:MAG TPA: DUF4159 domain-containing protein [Tepidisphaeraceae bacterium]
MVVLRPPGGRWFAPLLAWLAVASAMAVRPAAGATREQIDAAIEKGKQYLYSQLKKDGTWEEVSKPEINGPKQGWRQLDYKARQWGGQTAICAYALIAAGENPQDPKLKPAIDFLLKANIQSTYGLGLSAQVWNLIPPSPETRAVATHTVHMLDQGMIRQGPSAGFYGYWTGDKRGTDQPRWSDASGLGPQPKGWHDLSNSQYGVLGMWALEQTGAEVPNDFWKTVDEAWKKAQHEDGGWSYQPKKDATPSMTAAGIATLFITQDYTMPDTWSLCKGGSPTPEIDKGMAWMDKHIDEVIKAGDCYTFYGLERIGVASGRKYFGQVDWFQRGADTLVKKQEKAGSWNGDHGRIPNTCFALLFLTRGGAPVMMNKLEYETPRAEAGVMNVWNERPRDAANLGRWTGRQLEHDLNWQTVNMEVSPDDLHDATILYISGSQQMAYSPAKIKKFRQYVEQGGLILGNADCGKPEFTKSFIRLGTDLFPQYEFRQLPATHTIYTHEQYNANRWKDRPNVLGLSNGVRELMVLVPDADPSRAWQTHTYLSHENLFELGADVFLYAIDKKNLLSKGKTYIVEANPKIKATKRVKIARVIAGPNPDPEPGGWRRLAAIMHNAYKIDLEIYNAKPGEGSLLAARIAHFTGTTGFKLSDPARLELKAFVQNGGTLIIDAAGGNAAFAASAAEELRVLFGSQAAAEIETPLPKDSPVYNLPGEKIETAGYRIFAKESLPRGTKLPTLRGMTFGKKIRVFYSPLDLSAGLVGEPVDGVFGYDPQTSTELMSAMIRYAAEN